MDKNYKNESKKMGGAVKIKNELTNHNDN